MNILVLNSGSSTLKFQIIATDPERIRRNADLRLLRGEIEKIGGDASVKLKRGNGSQEKFTKPIKDIAAALEFVLEWAAAESSGIAEIRGKADIHAVGHRVVHGGDKFTESALITDEVLKGIEDCIELAPLHNPNNIKGILAVRERFGSQTPQVAVFDTAFHHSLPEHAYLYGIPYDYYARYRVRRYGFHGTSHRYVAERYRALRNLTLEQTNIVTLHLGNGSSAAAIRNGRSVDTSMGMTPLEGLVMGTRSGDIDPAILGYMAAKKSLSLAALETMLNEQSGLLGISGISNDMRILLREARDHNNQRARLAIDLFCYRARKYIGAYLAAMGGAEAIIFTGGIGENSPEVRAKICEGLPWAGLALDREKNEAAAQQERVISEEGSRLQAYVIPTDEELLIARDTLHCVVNRNHAP